jgi:trigger factor
MALKIVLPEYGSITLSKADLLMEGVPVHERQTLLRETVIREVMDRCEISVPEASVTRRVDRMIGNFKRQLSTSGVAFADYLAQSGRSEETLHEQLRDMATEAIKKEAVLWYVAQAEGILVQPDEVAERVSQIAALSGDDSDEARSALEQGGRMPLIVQEILFDKVSDFLVDRCFDE